MTKHPRTDSVSSVDDIVPKRPRATFTPNKVATAEAAAVVDDDPPFLKLLKAVEQSIEKPARGESVIFWMRMADLRVSDNRGLCLASKQAQREGIPLVVLFALSPQDYIAHDRSARRIDFTLRNLSKIRETLAGLHIPLHTMTHSPRRTLPSRILTFVLSLSATRVFANMEYEVDELRRDVKFCDIAGKRGVKATFVHNKCIVEPGVILTKEKKAYAVFSPYRRNWLTVVNGNTSYYLEDCLAPHANSESVRTSAKVGPLFDTTVPHALHGFELKDDDRKRMTMLWPEGEEVALKILDQFLFMKSRSSQLGAVSPFTDGAQMSEQSSRILNYNKDRDRADRDTTSRLSVYLSSGVISARACIRATMLMLNTDELDGNGTSGIGRWVQEIAWRDFYTCVLTGFPRVSMGRPFLEKFSAIIWEDHQAPVDVAHRGGYIDPDGEMLKKWKEGTTGVPIVDATMRCLNCMGWVHNRMRMITAMFLTKDLMIDWRVGERYFMEQLIDGDLASNNGGWQWSASTGADSCPYFRIFNPYTQSLKADPTGDFIRYWVPELQSLKGSDLHNPPASTADKLGYPRPIVQHNEARLRALRRFKNPGEV